MKYRELQSECGVYRNALLLERLISGARRRRAEKRLRIVLVVFLVLWLAASQLPRVPFLSSLSPEFAAAAGAFAPALAELLFLALGVWMGAVLLWSFYASSYFKDADTILPEPFMSARPLLRFEVAVAANEGSGDPVVDFLGSRYGIAVALRLGLSAEEVVAFLNARRGREGGEIEIPASSSGAPLGLAELAKGLVRADEGLRGFFAAHAIDEADAVGAALFVSRREERYKMLMRSWGRDALGRIPGIGKDWGYGEIALLERYATEMSRHPTFRAASGGLGKREAGEIERILSRGREANALLVGEEGAPLISALAFLARRIEAGTVLPPLEHKRIFVLDGALFVSAMKEKTAFERELTRLLSEAARAGNIIFVFDHFDAFFEDARSLGSDALAVLDPFFASQEIQIVAIAGQDSFHKLLEPNPKIKERFEKVQMEGTGAAASLPLIEEEAGRLEAKEGVFFTFQALRAAAESAERYFPEGVMPDKALDLLNELPKAKAQGKEGKGKGRRIISREDVLELVSRKTGIAAGETKGEERAKLLKLEEILHERIVGQDEAVSAIAGALRRARSGIGNPNRPLGSFLFLGPTGVGKTETTKALAQAFFGDEKQITRFDMSEYQTPDALTRLIGDFEGGKPGVLASALRERPYGVLLLDEFEKTNKDIHDLFLQILDEGFFADAAGRRVNARNLMIIATSNAGSDVIWSSLKEGKGLDKDRVITEIISRGIFRPEFLNRFDGVILFHPLEAEHLRVVARLQLQKLAKRLEEKGIELAITDALLDFLVSVGQDPKFGARPMNRAIQEKVEGVIAEKMLRGEVSAGSRVELGAGELG